MVKQKAPISVLEFSDQGLYCCRSEVRFKNRRLTHCFSLKNEECEKGDPRVLGRHFRKRRFRPKDPIVVIPRHLAGVQTLRLPSQDKRELDEMVRLHVSRNSGFSAEELVYDYQFAGLDSQGYALVHLYSLPKSRLDHYLGVLKKLDLNPSLVTLNVEGIRRWLLLQKAGGDTEGRFSCLLTATADVFDFNVFCDGRTYFSRSFSFSPIAGPERVSLLLREIKVSLELCRRLGGVEFIFDKKIYAAGAFTPDEILALRDHNFFNTVVIEDTIDAAQPILRSLEARERFSFASCLGLALNPESGCMDMRPPVCREEARGRAASRLWRNIALAFSCVYIFSWFLYAAKIEDDAKRLTRLNNDIRPQAGILALGDAVARGLWVNDHFVSTPVYQEILSALGRHNNPGILLNECFAQDGTKISLKGAGKDMASVLDYFKSLKTEKIFRKSRIEYLIQNQNTGTQWPVMFKVVSP